MKTLSIYITLFFCSVAAFAQDTIYVSRQMISHIIFPAGVKTYLWGNRADYEVLHQAQSPSTLFVSLSPSGAMEKASATTLWVDAGGEVYTYFLAYSPRVVNPYIDLRDLKTGNLNNVQVQRTGKRVTAADVKRRASSLAQSSAKPLKTIGGTGGDILIAVSDIRTDGSFVYLKCKVVNRGTAAYTLDLVSFNYQSGQGGLQGSNEVESVFALGGGEVTGRSEGEFVYAIPLYALKKGSLQLSFSESSGMRGIEVKVPARVINKAKTI